jgi:LysR family transcriptional regulator, hydrogen peroxide-inducible genes activator
MSALPTLKQLQYFLALGKSLHFTRAAEFCHVSQSTLSAGLKELEDILGAQLVERDRQSVSLTPIGKEVMARAQGLVAQAEDLSDFVKTYSGAMTGLVRLGVIPTIAPFILPKLLPALSKQYPQLQIGLREDLTAKLLQKLHNHELDFALIALPYDTHDLLVKEVLIDEFWLVAPKGDPVLSNKDIRLTASLAERLLLLEEGHCLRDHSMQACKRSEMANWKGLEASSLLTLVQMVQAGMGVALIPELAIKGGLLNQTKLIARPLAIPTPKRSIALVARQTTARIDAFTTIASQIKDHFQR